MEDITYCYICENCSAQGLLFIKSDDDVLNLIHCPSCAYEIHSGDFETDKLLSPESLEEMHDAINDFNEFNN